MAVRDLTRAIDTWIDVGTPDAARLHKASKAATRVVVYTYKAPRQFLSRLAGEKIHRADKLELYAIDRALVSALVARAVGCRRSPNRNNSLPHARTSAPTARAQCYVRMGPAPRPA